MLDSRGMVGGIGGGSDKDDGTAGRAFGGAAARDGTRPTKAARCATGLALGDRIAEQAFHLDAAMHRLLADVRAFDAGRHWADEGAASCAAWLSWRVGWTPGTGREHVRVARALGALPLIDGALADGRLSYSKVRAITRVATPATEAALLNDAIHTTASQLESICRKFGTAQRAMSCSPDDLRARRTVTRRTREDGMVVIEAVLPADEAAIVYAAIEREAARLLQVGRAVPAQPAETSPPPGRASTDVPAEPAETPPPPPARASIDIPAETLPTAPAPALLPPRLDRADGLVAIAQAALRGDALDRAPVEVVLTIGRDALARDAARSDVGRLGAFADGTCVSAETARRLACDSGVVELHEDAAGAPLSVGRRRRTVPAALARALAHRDPSCRFPGCTNRHFLDAHHLVHWIHGGETSLANTARLCGRHHRFVHEHGYRVEWRDGALAFFDPAGKRVHDEPPRTVRAPLGWPAICAAAAASGIIIDPFTGRSRWDGRPVDDAWVVDDLCRAEYRRPRA